MENPSVLFSDHGRTSIGLQSKFLLGLGCIFICFCIIATTLLYLREKKSLEQAVYHKTELIMAAVESTRDYVREVLRPKMYDILGDDKSFVLEAMSTSYISRVVMERFQHRLPTFEYRRVAINARNPNFEANELERTIISYFSEHHGENDWHGIIKNGKQHMYMRFRPVRYTTSCFRCHGNPADAPQAIKDLYGSTHGFNRRLGKVEGVVSVAVPVHIGLMAILEVAWKVFCTAFVTVALLYGSIWFFFNKLIIRDLQGLLEIFRDNLKDDHGAQLYEQAKAKDELGEMATAVQVVARHLQKTRRQLEDYTKNLEKKVADRTLALRHSEAILRQQVITRGQELRTLNTISELITRSVHLVDILPNVLQQALKVIPAQGAGIYLLDRKKAELVLQCREKADILEQKIPFDPAACLPFLDEKRLDFDGFIEEATCSQISLTEEKAILVNNFNVPLCCRGQILGIMTFVGNDLQDVDAQLQELLFSIGHQIGITIESLQNIVRLMNSKELLQSVFDGITDIVILLDAQYRIKMVNRAFLNQHGISGQDILNRALTELPTDNPCPLRACTTPLAEMPRHPVVEQVHDKDDNIYEVTFYPQFSDDNEVRNVICFAKNITEKKEVERRIQQTEKLVAIGQLAAGVAHEINNPLGVILCYTDIIKENNSDCQQTLDDVTVIERHTENCRRIVADLLDFSHSRKSGVNQQPAAINDMLNNVLSMLKQQFRKHNITVQSALDTTIPPGLMDARRMKQVFLNLLMNAAQAIGRDGTISIQTRMEYETIIIDIEDDGPGISKDMQNKIFDPFFSTKEPGEGTGLGLSVSYGIVREHDGEITVRSRPDQGARFTIAIPFIQDIQEVTGHE